MYISNKYLRFIIFEHVFKRMFIYIFTEIEKQEKLQLVRRIQVQTEQSDICTSPIASQPKCPAHLDPRNIIPVPLPSEESNEDALRKLNVVLKLASLYAEQAALPEKACRERSRPITSSGEGAKLDRHAPAHGPCGLLNLYAIFLVNLLFLCVVLFVVFPMFYKVK